MQAHDGHTAALLACQVTDKENPVYGSFVRWAYTMDTRSTGFALAHLLISYLAPRSRYHLDEQVKEAICGALTYLETHQRPDGCLDLNGYGDDVAPDLGCVTHYEQHFRVYRMLRTHSGNVSWTLMDGKPNCLYFQHRAAVMYRAIYENLCDQLNFRSDKVEKIDGSYRMTCRQSCWYYLPFEEKPATSDWWAMDNPHTRQRLNTTMDTTMDVIFTDDGMDVTIRTSGLDQLSLRVEFGFAASSQLRHHGFLMEGKAGQSLLLTDGALEVIAPCGGVITLSGGFAEHANLHRYGDANQQIPDHFTVYMTAFTPVEKTIHIGTKRLFGETLF